MDQGTSQTRVRIDKGQGTIRPALGYKMSIVGYETSRVRNICNSFPILPETCAKTIGQNVKHSIKAPFICCRIMIQLQG